MECLREAFGSYRARYTVGAFLDTVPPLAELQKRLALMCVLVAATPSGEIAGTVVNADEGHVRGMAVRGPGQGTGEASELIRSVESELRERKCSRIGLDTRQSCAGR